MNSPLQPPAPEERTRTWAGILCSPGRRRIIGISATLLLALLAGSGYLYIRHKWQKNREPAKAPAAEPLPAPAVVLPKIREIIGSFKPNQTITQALLEQGLPNSLVFEIIDSARPVYNLAKVKARQFYWVYLTEEGKFRDFRYPIDDERFLTVYHDVAQNRLVSVVKNYPFETRVEPVSAVIADSLFSAIVSAGEQDQLALDLADIFGSDIDFNTDIQSGDSFRVLVEKKYLNNVFVKYGAILAATITNQQKLLTGFRFEDENGKPAYYAPDGRALKRSFLKSPLRIVRITSRFSRARMHPILRILRPHLGVDYAAPIGTPVQAVGAGTVVGAGFNGGSGRMVRLRHSGGYETMYLHLSRIAVKTGARVDQGQVVGYVGSSGLSTGPHLDFRILRHGNPINPAKVIFPPGKPVQSAEFDRFAALRDRLAGELGIAQQDWKHASTTGSPPR